MATVQLDHYQALMLDPGVDMDLMTTVYRRLVQRYQSVSAGDGPALERLRVIERAYEVLRDPFRRARYDAGLVRAQDDELAHAAQSPAAPQAVVAPSMQAAQAVPMGLAARVAVPVVSQRPSASQPVAVSVLDFGRYAGWSLRQIAARDPDYLHWLLRSPGGRQYRAQITALLQPR
ncbi:MAG: DnaJ domain-containing protein [Chloroflexi bacterium]|nr:DnaJ domain-containing protein [Chloroflexota bacterium]